jgi:preprotein translocase subunit SecF
MFFWHGLPLGVDFKGGTLVYVKFSQSPNLDAIRGALDKAGMHNASIQSYGPPASNEVVIKLEQKETSEAALDQGRSAIQSALNSSFDPKSFEIRNVEIVGPQVGAQLRHQALLATLYSLAGMLVYLWFRFELIYGVAAVVAVFHDTLITLGAFSLLNYEISLTVIAAILTLIGYSMNDTIVVFDRIRENLKLSINQTLSRTILTSGLTFLTVLSLYIFGGEVLHGFSFALVVGILIGTYSSIAVAAPMLVAYQESRGDKSRAVPVSIESGRREKQRA